MPIDKPTLRNPVADSTYAGACEYRLRRVREQLSVSGLGAILLYDPINIRYATETSNMQVWTMHNQARYALIFAEGPAILWEFHNCEHLHDGNQQVDEIRNAVNWSYFVAGERRAERATVWAGEIASVFREHAGENQLLAVDTVDSAGLDLLEGHGIDICCGESVMQQARLVKSPEELELMRWTMQVCEAGMTRMYEALQPGMSEQELWAWLHYENARHGGEWLETRLLSSGPRTNPWMQEAGPRKMASGDLICFDTDLIGPYGYCADVSRTWVVGHETPSRRQRELYAFAFEQIATNAALLKPGVSYREISERAWVIPERFYDNRYSFILHGVGMCDEYPGIAHWGEDWDRSGSDGRLERNMVVSVESYIGERGGSEGVKLEQQFVIGATGAESFCSFPFNDDWL